MKVISSVSAMQRAAIALKRSGKSIGFVPTMGCLHEGHISLVRGAKRRNDVAVMSIFVNPTQFGPKEDFKKYPRTFKRDRALAKASGVDILFYPPVSEIYPKDFSTYVNVERVTDGLCGASRAGHFKGVATIVAKLINIVQCDDIYMGQKDAQQAVVIRRLVDDLNMPVKVSVLPIIREEDGLAISSRNRYLKGDERQQAILLSRALKAAKTAVVNGEISSRRLVSIMKKVIARSKAARIDYIAIVDPDTLLNISVIKGRALIALAVFIGKTRLIDNAVIRTR